MRRLLLLACLATVVHAQTATDRLSHFVRGGRELSWLELGEVLVTATMDEDAAAVARELIANLDAGRPADNRQRALRALLRWSQLPNFAAQDTTDGIGRALLPVIESSDAAVELRGQALVALGHLPRQASAQIGKVEAALRRRLSAKAKDEAVDAAMAPFELQFLAVTAPESLWTLPLVAAVTREAESGSDTWKAGLRALTDLGRSGATTDARTAFTACAALLPGAEPQFVAANSAMAALLRSHPDLLDAEAPLQAALSLLRAAQAMVEAKREAETGLGSLQSMGAGRNVRSVGLAAMAALARLQPEAAREAMRARFDAVLRRVGDSDPDLRALLSAWNDRGR